MSETTVAICANCGQPESAHFTSTLLPGSYCDRNRLVLFRATTPESAAAGDDTLCPKCGNPCTFETTIGVRYCSLAHAWKAAEYPRISTEAQPPAPIAGKADEMPEDVFKIIQDAANASAAGVSTDYDRAVLHLASLYHDALRDNAAFRQREMDRENAEASVCPEDVGFVEYIGPLKSALDKAQQFKAYVHDRLDKAGIPRDPDPEHTQAEGCRIGGRLDYVFSALDRAQRERDEAVNAYEKTMIQRDMARNELAGERRSHEMLANLRRNQLLVNAALQKECDAMRKLVTEAIGWDEEAIHGEQLSAAIAEYRASLPSPEPSGYKSTASVMVERDIKSASPEIQQQRIDEETP